MPTDRYIYTREGYQNLDNCSASVRNSRYRLVRTARDTLLYDMISDPSQLRDISEIESEVLASMSELLLKWEKELVSAYEPVTTIRAGFEEERYFVLPVQDAILAGNLRYSSIHPNQSHTDGWSEAGDSLYWNLEIEVPGVYNVELQYGCPPGKPGSEYALFSAADKINFSITEPFESFILPERDYVKRSESVERTWTWMNAGDLELRSGREQIILKLLKPSGDDAGLIKAIKLTRLNG
jgi:arylsulfatase A